MKKGDLVTFIGTNLLKRVDKTYIWGVNKDLYLIQHPDGIEFNDENKHSFEQYKGIVLAQGKKYIECKLHELISLVPAITTENTSNPIQIESTEVFVDEIITVNVPKSLLLNLKNYFENQAKMMDENEEIPGIPKVFSKMLKGFMNKNKDEVLEMNSYFVSGIQESLLTAKPLETEVKHPEPQLETSNQQQEINNQPTENV